MGFIKKNKKGLTKIYVVIYNSEYTIKKASTIKKVWRDDGRVTRKAKRAQET